VSVRPRGTMSLDATCILYIDGGTTRTRAWAAVGDRVVAFAQAEAGAGDAARTGDRTAWPTRGAVSSSTWRAGVGRRAWRRRPWRWRPE
jgi:2-keto-3-deoxy-galactonokinase